MTRSEFLKAAAAALVQTRTEPPLVPRPKRYRAMKGVTRLAGKPADAAAGIGDPGAPGNSPEAYRLLIERDRISLTGRSEAALAMGRRTLAQLAVSGPIPCCEIVDWPDAAVRSAHLCYHLIRESLAYNCPNYEALLTHIDELAALKYNGVLLELESMFPYRRHPDVTCKIAFTRQQIRTIRERLSGHGMEIVPLVQCLGHAYNVLIHERYAGYREVPGTFQQYCPTNPKVADLYMEFVDEYLELFPGLRRWHLGGDESRQLAQCPRCKEKAAREGLSRLYVDHVAEIARRVKQRGLTPLLWSDMLEHHPEALSLIPSSVQIVYWNYDMPRWPRPYLAELFRKQGFPVICAPAVRFGSSGTELSVFYPEALRGLETLIGRMLREGDSEVMVTNWMKGSPHENTHYGFAYAADLCWDASLSRSNFQDRYAALFFGLPDRAVTEVYETLSLKLPYAEPVQNHMPDRLNRFDLSGLRFPEKWKRYTSPDQEPAVLRQIEEALAGAASAGRTLRALAPKAVRGKRQLDLLLLSAECIQAKARLARALHAGRALESGARDQAAVAAWLAGQPAILAAWRQAKRRHRELLLSSGFAPSIDFLNDLMFEPAEADFFVEMARRLRA